MRKIVCFAENLEWLLGSLFLTLACPTCFNNLHNDSQVENMTESTVDRVGLLQGFEFCSEVLREGICGPIGNLCRKSSTVCSHHLSLTQDCDV